MTISVTTYIAPDVTSDRSLMSQNSLNENNVKVVQRSIPISLLFIDWFGYPTTGARISTYIRYSAIWSTYIYFSSINYHVFSLSKLPKLLRLGIIEPIHPFAKRTRSTRENLVMLPVTIYGCPLQESAAITALALIVHLGHTVTSMGAVKTDRFVAMVTVIETHRDLLASHSHPLSLLQQQ